MACKCLENYRNTVRRLKAEAETESDADQRYRKFRRWRLYIVMNRAIINRHL
ncbi:MAG: hypothetical protein ACQEXB_24510 [Bacillota bacterium]